MGTQIKNKIKGQVNLMDCTIINMKTDNMENPNLIDNLSPSFSWNLKSHILGQKQTTIQRL